MTETAAERIVDAARAAAVVAAWREGGEKIVFADGVFELLDVAAVRRLARARTPGARLVVGVIGDRASAARLGGGRPVVGARDRAALVAALRGVDLVVIHEEATPDALLEELGPVTHAAAADEGGGLIARVRALGGGGA